VRNFVPSSTELVSPSSRGAGGTVEAPQILQQGPATTLIVTPAEGISVLPLSSYARLLIATAPEPETVPVKVQLVVPVACAQVAPPLSDTSTPATMPPPASDAVPVTVMDAPEPNDVPAAGDVIVEVGASVSVDADAVTRPDCSVEGCVPISASK